jgi:hypothetical protein
MQAAADSDHVPKALKLLETAIKKIQVTDVSSLIRPFRDMNLNEDFHSLRSYLFHILDSHCCLCLVSSPNQLTKKPDQTSIAENTDSC